MEIEVKQRIQAVFRLCILPILWLVFIGQGVLTGIRIPCVFYLFTGLQCPGCGLTRAMESLLHGEIYMAIGYNLLVIPLTFALIIVMVDTCRYIRTGKTIWSRFTSRHSIVLMVLLLAYMAARNIF